MTSRLRLAAFIFVAVIVAATSSVVTGSTPVAAAGVQGAPGCAVSAPAVPLMHHHLPYFINPYVSLTATNNRGTWAGVRYPGDYTVQVITWRAGHTTILDTFDYRSQAATYPTWVRVVGVDDSGSVVVDAIPVGSGNVGTTQGYRYQNGRRFQLAHNADWLRFDPTSVAPDGRISGEVRTRRLNAVVEWTGSGSGKATVISTGRVAKALVDQYGDFLWTSWAAANNEYPTIHIRTLTGRQLQLGGFSYFVSDTAYQLSAGRFLFGEVDTDHQIVGAVWDMSLASALPDGGTIPLHRLLNGVRNGVVRAAGNGGYVVVSNPPGPTFRYFDAQGDVHALPSSFGVLVTADVIGIAADGTVAEIGTDGNVRFIRCAADPTNHQPAGRLYGATTSGNTVSINGGVIDPDARSAPVNVDLIENDRAAAGSLIGRYPASQSNLSAAAVWYRLQRHSFSATFTASAGPHTFCVIAENLRLGDSNPDLGCVSVNVPGSS